MKSMESKRVLFVGASSEIGKKLLPYFIKDDKYTLILHYFEEKIENGYYADIRKTEEVEDMVSKILKKYGSIDILINCAGTSVDRIAHKYDYEDWKKTIDVNLNGVFYSVREVLPSMRKNNYGRIIIFSSVIGRIGVPGTVAYSASKAGLMGLTRTIAIENITKGITCNCIGLGYVNAGLTVRLSEKLKKQILERIPIKRFCEIYEIYNTIDFLIRTPYITGQTIDLNGGLFLIWIGGRVNTNDHWGG